MIIKIVIVGNGKLAKSLLENLDCNNDVEIIKWNDFDKVNNEKIIMIHVGSGRELNECIIYAKKSKSILINLSTSDDQYEVEGFTYIICPNIALSVLKLMAMLQKYGAMFDNEKISILESHQKSKTTIAGTAIEFSKYLNQPSNMIKSIRECDYQKNIIGIPNRYLDLHVYHKNKN